MNKRNQDHRRPPKPPWYDTAPPGVCRWCNKPVPRTDGKESKFRWHDACVKEFQLIFWPNVTAARTARRAGYKCAGCGLIVHGGDHDHVIPLCLALPHAEDPYWPWRAGNLQWLCPDCHKAKTAAEAGQRAAMRAAWETKNSGQDLLPFARGLDE